MTVKKTNGRWRIDISYPGGRIRKFYPTKMKATAAHNRIVAELENGTYFDQRKDEKITVANLCAKYLGHTSDKKKSHERDQSSSKHVIRILGKVKIAFITPISIEDYRTKRKRESDKKGNLPKPATINRELAFLKRVFSWGIENQLISKNPVKIVKLEKENNARDRILTKSEFRKLLEASAPHLRPVFITAYYTAMRKSEILNLQWKQVDLKNGFIRLEPEQTKTNEGRDIPLHPEVIDALKGIRRKLHIQNVFTYQDQPLRRIRTGFAKACRKAGIKDFWFHDFRHTAITNWRRMGHDFITIMAATGHKNLQTFKRYNTVTRDDLKGLNVPKVQAFGQ